MLSRSVDIAAWPPTDRIWVLVVCPLTEGRSAQGEGHEEVERQPQIGKPGKGAYPLSGYLFYHFSSQCH